MGMMYVCYNTNHKRCHFESLVQQTACKSDPPHRCPCIHAAQFDDVTLLTFEICHAKYFFEIFEGRGGLEIHHIGMGMLLSLDVAAATAWGTQLEGSVVIHLLTMYNVEKATVR